MKRIIKVNSKKSDILNNRSDEIDVRKEGQLTREITLALKDAIREKNLNALSAPQLGYSKRIFCIRFGKEIKTFINPILTNVGGLEMSKETCSSIPNKTYIRPRHNEVTFICQTPLGKIESLKLVGLAARVFQHQLDHLDGLLLNDVGLEVEDDFFNASEEERGEVINAYLESLDLKQKEIDKEIEEDKDLKQVSDAIKFMTSVAKGETKLVKQEKAEEES